jgi:NADH dehydrogenase
VELAGQVRELAVRSLRREFRNFDPDSVRVVLVDAGKEPLPSFGDNLAQHARRAIEDLGVELHMGGRVSNIDATGVDVDLADGTTAHFDARIVVWAAGVQASPLAAELARASGAETDRIGRIKVLPDLTLPGHPEVFAVGDMTALNDLPGVAEVAMQGSLHAANTIRHRLLGNDHAKPFKYRDLGSVAVIGRFRAVFSWRRIKLSGMPAWIVWLFVHLGFLNSFASRFGTIFRWSRSMIGRARSERVISVARGGGDLSAPGANPYEPIVLADLERPHEEAGQVAHE